MLSNRVIQIIKCPRCGNSLTGRSGAFACNTSQCSEYPVINGAVVLIDDEQSVHAIDDFRLAASAKPRRSSVSKKAILSALPGMDRNSTGKRNMLQLQRLLIDHSDRPLVLILGGKHPTSSVFVLRQFSNIEFIESDLRFSPGTAMIADLHCLPLEDSSVDGVVVDAMLEHVLDPQKAAHEMHRVLKPNGIIYADSPFMLQVHGGALDFYRFSHLGHRRLFRYFDEIASGVTAGPAAALGYSIQYFLLSFVKSRAAKASIEIFCRLSLFWLKYLDTYLAARPGALDAAQGFFFLGRKTTSPMSDLQLLGSYGGTTRAFYPHSELRDS